MANPVWIWMKDVIAAAGKLISGTKSLFFHEGNFLKKAAEGGALEIADAAAVKNAAAAIGRDPVWVSDLLRAVPANSKNPIGDAVALAGENAIPAESIGIEARSAMNDIPAQVASAMDKGLRAGSFAPDAVSAANEGLMATFLARAEKVKGLAKGFKEEAKAGWAKMGEAITKKFPSYGAFLKAAVKDAAWWKIFGVVLTTFGAGYALVHWLWPTGTQPGQGNGGGSTGGGSTGTGNAGGGNAGIGSLYGGGSGSTSGTGSRPQDLSYDEGRLIEKEIVAVICATGIPGLALANMVDLLVRRKPEHIDYILFDNNYFPGKP